MTDNAKNPVLKLELVGIVFIVLVGSALHFTFDLSGSNPLVGIFSAVNESVWEHLKLSFWPALLYAVIEYGYLNRKTGSFFPAKTIGIYLMPLIIVFSFYLYRAFIEENLVIDILIFILAVAIGQFASYRLMTWKATSRIYTPISIVALILLAILFIIFTFYPPQLPIFQDPISGGYGFK
ncbi:MAG: DUF6512 family protein [Methanomassiliicoccales archaeon]|nr:DUF6512 family protein [Methanomassiliicoccales archaeon]